MKIRDEIPAKLLLVGDGPEKHRVMALAKETAYKKDILFLGKQENVEELFAISDLMLLLSEMESFGLVLLEAMACGVPGIGTATGGIPEVIEHGVNGYLVQLGDTEAAALYALDILTNEEKLIRFREAAIATSNEKFNSKQIIDHYEQLYERLAVLRV